MNLPTFKEHAVRQMASDESFFRGEQYLDAGAVRRLAADGNTYRAYVQGTHRYTVEVWVSGDAVETSCTCPYDWGGICKHVVALMLAVLRQAEAGQAVQLLAEKKTVDTVLLDPLLDELSVEDLRDFIRGQVAEFPQLANNLQIFSAGAAETVRKVEDYAAQIEAALKAASIVDPSERYDRYEYYDDENEDDEVDTIDSVLRPYRDMANKYQAQGNWIEYVKIQEALVRACGSIATVETEDEEDTEEYEDYDDEAYYDDDTGYLESVCLDAANRALGQWATVLAERKPAKDKKRMLERLVCLFAADSHLFESEHWEEAFKNAVGTAQESKQVLTIMKKQVKRLDQQQDRAGVLMHLLELSGETERFLKVGRRAVKIYFHLALPLGEKLAALGRRAEAFDMAESVLAEIAKYPYAYGYFKHRSTLYRFLLRVGNRQRDYRRMVECAKVLLFAENQRDDYFFLRDLLQNKKEKERLIEEIKEECTGEALIAILSAEKRWEDLLDVARKKTDDSAFYRMIEAVQDRFPGECFDLYRQVLLDVADSGTGRQIYQQVAFHARQLQAISDHEQEFAELMALLLETYPRRRGLIEELGDLAELGKAWLDRARQTRLKRVNAKQMKGMDIGELVAVCPISEAEQEKLGRRTTWQRGSATLVWAILVSQGGRLDAADITAAIAAYRGCTQQSAGSQRSGGIRMLEALGYIKVKREKNKLGEVRLIKR